MVERTGRTDNCERSADVVSYIYGETGAAERLNFEAHLADCQLCIDELADASFARFSVYEWNKEEFAKLPTPAFSIPYAKAAETVRSQGTFAGMLDGWRTLVNSLSWPAAAASFALLVIVLGSAVFFVGYLRIGTTEIARNDNSSRPAGVSNTGDPGSAASVPLRGTATTETRELVGSTPSGSMRNSTVSVKATASLSDPRSKKPARNLEANAVRSGGRNAARQSTRPPSLSGSDEDVDDSLRLTDLFSDTDTLRR